MTHERRGQDDDPRSIASVALARTVPPCPATRVVHRGRLLDALDAGTSGPLTLVTGPPGAGKTLLLSTWLAERKRFATVAWLSIERRDSGPPNFWRAVLDAVDTARESGLASLAPMLPGSEDEFLSAFANAVAALPQPLLVILDDFNEIQTSEVGEQLDTLLRHPPENLRFVIASRVDPRLSLQRLHLEGRLTELRSADLAFTRDEAAELFEVAGLRFTDEQLATLHSRTEGWVAGLRLAALSMEANPDADELVRNFAGDERSVADYLVEEVVHRQPTNMREFMLRTSVVDFVNPELADALTGGDDGTRLLERLERSNAFLLPLDDHRGWYRYHPLFAELLRSELRYRMPEAFAAQHRRAARWYASNELDMPAIRHALTAKDWDLAANLLSAHWFTLVVEGRAGDVVDLIGELPREMVVRDPELSIAAAGALLDAGELERAETYIDLADQSAGAVPHKRLADFTLARTIVSLYAARLRGEFEATLGAARKVLTLHPAATLSVSSGDRRAVALLNLGIAEFWVGETRQAHEHLEDALALARYAGSSFLVLTVLGRLALLEASSGAMRRAAKLAEEALRLAQKRGWAYLPQSAPVHLALASCTYHWGGLGDARLHVERAATAARPSRERTVEARCEIFRALVLCAAGDVETAEGVVRAARQGTAGWSMPRTLAASFAWTHGKVLAAAGRAPEALAAVEAGELHGRWAELDLVKARIALHEGDPAAALGVMEPALDRSVPALHPSTDVELHALAALAQHLRGHDGAALELVERALELAAPEGYRQVLLEVGGPLRELLMRRIRAGTAHRALAGDLVDALDPRSGRQADGEALLLDPLSGREEAVLRYLPTALSKAEIASEMFLSVNTVKTHMKNIYRKLHVTNRPEAVRRAKSLHLV